MTISKEQMERMEDLVMMLNEASERYYSGKETVSSMSDTKYDKMLGELAELEVMTGTQLKASPLNRVGYSEDGEKIQHTYPILSLNATKSVDDLLHFIKEEDAVLSWKLDGLSIVLYYSDGKLVRALSRGDGHWGKDITKNVLQLRHIPTRLSNRGEVIIRGEGCLSVKEFHHLKQTKEGEGYSNPRNLAAGLINTSRTTPILLRHMSFIAHTAISLGEHQVQTRDEQLRYMSKLGFRVIPYSVIANYQVINEVALYTTELDEYEFPVDGLVLTLNDIAFGESLGCTRRFPRHSMAFKWPDEYKTTRVRGMKWSVSRTGLITPVVLLEPVGLEGTTVRQANLHSLKVFEGLDIGVGDILRVYKANKIIPEVEENMTRSGTERYPERCPACGNYTEIVIRRDVQGKISSKKLYCCNCGGNHGSQE